jgi:hypothetical protein
MNRVLARRKRKISGNCRYRLTGYRRRPSAGRVLEVRVRFEDDFRLPRHIFMFIYQGGAPKAHPHSDTGELELELTEGFPT